MRKHIALCACCIAIVLLAACEPEVREEGDSLPEIADMEGVEYWAASPEMVSNIQRSPVLRKHLLNPENIERIEKELSQAITLEPVQDTFADWISEQLAVPDQFEISGDDFYVVENGRKADKALYVIQGFNGDDPELQQLAGSEVIKEDFGISQISMHQDDILLTGNSNNLYYYLGGEWNTLQRDHFIFEYSLIGKDKFAFFIHKNNSLGSDAMLIVMDHQRTPLAEFGKRSALFTAEDSFSKYQYAGRVSLALAGEEIQGVAGGMAALFSYNMITDAFSTVPIRSALAEISHDINRDFSPKERAGQRTEPVNFPTFDGEFWHYIAGYHYLKYLYVIDTAGNVMAIYLLDYAPKLIMNLRVVRGEETDRYYLGYRYRADDGGIIVYEAPALSARLIQ